MLYKFSAKLFSAMKSKIFRSTHLTNLSVVFAGFVRASIQFKLSFRLKLHRIKLSFSKPCGMRNWETKEATIRCSKKAYTALPASLQISAFPSRTYTVIEPGDFLRCPLSAGPFGCSPIAGKGGGRVKVSRRRATNPWLSCLGGNVYRISRPLTS